MRQVWDFQTRFQKVTIWKSALATEFRVAGAIHASFHQKRFLTGLTWDLIAAAALLRPDGEPKSVLMLGVAGGTALRTMRHLLPGVSLTGIDLDAELIGLAREEMDLDGTGAEIIIADAYEWMEVNQRRFDVIVDDLYLAGEDDVFRPGVCDEKWLDQVKNSLRPGGIFASNLVIGSGHRNCQIATRKALLEHFSCVRSLRTQESMNEVLVAGENVATEKVLEGHLADFSDWRDRMCWKRIDVRKL